MLCYFGGVYGSAVPNLIGGYFFRLASAIQVRCSPAADMSLRLGSLHEANGRGSMSELLRIDQRRLARVTVHPHLAVESDGVTGADIVFRM